MNNILFRATTCRSAGCLGISTNPPANSSLSGSACSLVLRDPSCSGCSPQGHDVRLAQGADLHCARLGHWAGKKGPSWSQSLLRRRGWRLASASSSSRSRGRQPTACPPSRRMRCDCFQDRVHLVFLCLSMLQWRAGSTSPADGHSCR
jgi:hypothetical protein